MEVHDAGEVYLGVIDAIVTIGVTLCAKGLLTREELAAAFDATAHFSSANRACPTAGVSPWRASAISSSLRCAAIAASR